MATCSTARWGPSSNSPYVKLTVTQSATTNTTVTFSWIYQYVSDYAAYISDRSYIVKINNTTVKSGTYNPYGKTGTSTIASGSITIAKGSVAKTIGCSCTFDFRLTWSGEYAGTKAASTSVNIPAIVTYTVSYDANGGSGAPAKQTKTAGKTLTLSTTKPSKAGYTFNNWSGSDSKTYTPGTTYSTDANLKLTAKWTKNDPKTYKVRYNANGGSGAPAEQTKTAGKTLTLSTTKPTRNDYAFKGWGSSATSTTVLYSAGGSYTADASITLYAIWASTYSKPTIGALNIRRCTASGTLSDDGTYAKITFSWTSSVAVSKIVITSLTGTTAVSTSTITPNSAARSGSVSQVIGEGKLTTEKSYIIKAEINDGRNLASQSKTLPSKRYTIDVLSGGKGIAFGKVASKSSYIESGWDLLFDKGLGIVSPSSNGTLYNAFQAMNQNDNTIIGYGHYANKHGDTNIYGVDIWLGMTSGKSTGARYRPYFRKGDSFAVAIRTAGMLTNGGHDVYFTVPVSRYIFDSPTITATTNLGMVLWQDGKYVCGSNYTVENGYTYAPVSKYTAYAISGSGIVVNAKMNVSTNAINNAPISVYWNGTITFS